MDNTSNNNTNQIERKIQAVHENSTFNNTNQNQIELRKIQTIHGNSTFVLVLPKDFVSVLSITKGDYVKCTIVDNSLVVKKADL